MALKNQLQSKLNDPGLTADEKTKLNNDIALLTTAYFKVFLADHLNIHVVFDHTQLALLHALDDVQTNDTQTLKNRFNTILTSLKDVTTDIKVQGGKSLNDVKAMIAAAKPSKDWPTIEGLQYGHINDGILHVMSEIALEKANCDNQLRKIQKLLKTIDPSKKDVLLDFSKGLQAQSDDNAAYLPTVEQRLNTDL